MIFIISVIYQNVSYRKFVFFFRWFTQIIIRFDSLVDYIQNIIRY